MNESFWAKLTGKQRERQQTLESRWAQAAKAVAEGKAPPAEKLDELLLATGKTVEDLRVAVERLLRRRGAKIAFQRAASVQMERAEAAKGLDAARAAYDAAVEAAKQKYTAAADPLRAKLADLERIEREGANAQCVLRDTAGPMAPDLATELDGLRARVRALDVRMAEGLKQDHNKSREAAEKDGVANRDPRFTTPGHLDRHWIEKLHGEAKQLRVEAEEHLADAAKAEEEAGPLRDRIAELEALFLEP
jgi:hypothetical protein